MHRDGNKVRVQYEKFYNRKLCTLAWGEIEREREGVGRKFANDL